MTDAPACAVVVAAGSSQRMAGLDKLEVEVAGRPLLAWSLDGLTSSPSIGVIVLVTAAARVAGLQAADWLPAKVRAVVAGGDRRHESVAAGLEALVAAGATDRDIVLVHDGARPLLTPDLVDRVTDAARLHGAAVPVVPLVDTLKRIAGDRIVETVDRSSLVAAQTPQATRVGDLRAAFARYPPQGPETWTDEGALLEACRIDVHAIPGDPANLKVTVPADLARVGEILARRTRSDAPPVRSGLGRDSHPFGPGAPLRLGGVAIEGAPRLHGHSDGDVALHAVADALLGAAGQGDLGRMFPAGPATPAGVASGVLLDAVVRRVGEAGYRPVALDLTIVAARPRLGPHLDRIRESVARSLGLPIEAVNVKASTGNLLGVEGAGRAISAVALATLQGAGSAAPGRVDER